MTYLSGASGSTSRPTSVSIISKLQLRLPVDCSSLSFSSMKKPQSRLKRLRKSLHQRIEPCHHFRVLGGYVEAFTGVDFEVEELGAFLRVAELPVGFADALQVVAGKVVEGTGG